MYFEKHNAAFDAADEAKIIKMLNVPYQTYIKYAAINSQNKITNTKSELTNKNDSSRIVQLNIDYEDTSPAITYEPETYASPISYNTFENATVSISSNDNNIIFADEASKLLGVSKSTVYNLIKREEIFAQKIGNKYHISKNSVLLYIENQKRKQRIALIFAAISIAIMFLILLVFFL